MPCRDNTFLVEPHSCRHLINQLALLLSWHCLPLGCEGGAEEVEDEPVEADAPQENLPCQVDEVDSGDEEEVEEVEEEVVVDEGAVE